MNSVVKSAIKPTVIITGAAGFIGSHLVDFYLNKNFHVIGIDNFITGTEEYVKKHFDNQNFYFLKMDVCESWDLVLKQIKKEVLDSLEYIFHFASPAAVNQFQQFSLETMWANSVGLSHAIQFADKFEARVIFASTSEVYGSPTISPQNETYWGNVNPFGQRSCYDESKRFGEALIYSTNKKNKTKHGVVRIFNTYGPRMNPHDGRVIIQFIRQALKNQDLTIYGDGEQTRSFCYIDDLINAITLYAQDKSIHIPMNIGNNTQLTVLDLAHLIIKMTQSKSKITYLSLPSDDPPTRCPDLQMAQKLLNYTPHVTLEEGLKKLILFCNKSEV